MPFPSIAGKEPIFIAPGVTLRTVWGDALMFSFVEFAHADALVATHQHPHEQMGLVLEGALELICGEERQTVPAGGVFLVPSNTPHSARAVGGPARALDVFYPRREDYMVEGGEVKLGGPGAASG